MKKAIIVVLLVAAICAFAGAENLKDTRVSQGISSKSTLTKQGLGTATNTKFFRRYFRKISKFVKGTIEKVEAAFVKLQGRAKARLEALKQKNKGSKGYVSKLPYSRHAMMGTNVYVHNHPINCGVVFEGQGEEIAEEECVKHLEADEEQEAEAKEESEDSTNSDSFLEVSMPVTSNHKGCNPVGIFGSGNVPSKCADKVDDSMEFVAADSLAACIESIHEARRSVIFSNKNTGDKLELWVENDRLWAKDNCDRKRRRLLQAGNENSAS